jgi:hypothetical protein
LGTRRGRSPEDGLFEANCPFCSASALYYARSRASETSRRRGINPHARSLSIRLPPRRKLYRSTDISFKIYFLLRKVVDKELVSASTELSLLPPICISIRNLPVTAEGYLKKGPSSFRPRSGRALLYLRTSVVFKDPHRACMKLPLNRPSCGRPS